MKTQQKKSAIIRFFEGCAGVVLAALLCAVSCKKADVLPSSVSVTPSSVTVTEGETATFTASVLPAEAVYSGITWSSSDTKVATVNNGVVTGVKAGSATITASADGVKGSATVTVTAKIIAVTGVSLDKTELALTEGDDAQLTATVAPDNATDKNVSWLSSDNAVATVSSDGKVTAVKAGTATIIVTTEDGGKTAICKVTVLANIDGALSGLFSVSDTRKVRFSKGNLQVLFTYSHIRANTYDFSFAEHQYDYVGDAPGNTTFGDKKNGSYLIDLFGWSTESTYYGISTSTSSSDYSGDFRDWGKKIGDGSTWRTLSTEEWEYLFKTRTNASGLYKKGVTVCGKTNCLVIAPDGFTGTIDASYNASTWPAAEAAGLICLPAVGYRYGSNVFNVGDRGTYWSSTAYDRYNAYSVYFDSDDVDPDGSGGHSTGYSVRLITDVK